MKTQTIGIGLFVCTIAGSLGCPQKQPPAPPAPPAPGPTAAAPASAPATPSPPTPPPATGGVILSEFAFPGGKVTVPKSWSPAFVNQPPKIALNVTPSRDVTCDLAVLVGHGTEKQAEDYLLAGAATLDGKTPAPAPAIVLGGYSFRGIRVTDPKPFADKPGAFVDLYVTISDADLITVGIVNLTAEEQTVRRTECLRAFAALPKARLPKQPATP